jgi:hypothetical protein
MNGSELLLGDQQEMRVRRETLGAQVYHLLRDRMCARDRGGSRLIQGPPGGREPHPRPMRLSA